VQFTKQALNNWYRAAGPSFDASLALEFYGFGLDDVREGVAAHREKRSPRFS
jgi:enoyl-CoA hydratase